jgi:hypothetical protein
MGILFSWTRRTGAAPANPGFAIRNLGEAVLRVPDAPVFSHDQDPSRTSADNGQASNSPARAVPCLRNSLDSLQDRFR